MKNSRIPIGQFLANNRNKKFYEKRSYPYRTFFNKLHELIKIVNINEKLSYPYRTIFS